MANASETKTTPATEQRCECGRAIERPDLYNACHRCVVGPEDPRDNADLLAAAPELLEACKTTLSNIRSLKFAYAGVRTWDAWEELLERVIAKAEPEAELVIEDDDEDYDDDFNLPHTY